MIKGLQNGLVRIEMAGNFRSHDIVFSFTMLLLLQSPSFVKSEVLDSEIYYLYKCTQNMPQSLKFNLGMTLSSKADFEGT